MVGCDFHFNNIFKNHGLLSYTSWKPKDSQPHFEDNGCWNFMPGHSWSPQVGVVQYGERVVHEFYLDDFHTVDDVVSAAQKIIQRGGEETRTALGINVARYTKSRSVGVFF